MISIWVEGIEEPGVDCSYETNYEIIPQVGDLIASDNLRRYTFDRFEYRIVDRIFVVRSRQNFSVKLRVIKVKKESFWSKVFRVVFRGKAGK
ncbi:hypothetical protein DYBT9275_02777 [Dyadobacter sp. CECT 9275]|uniref:Uncharacterized protein n=1 Tax=Dyadobacter helix TaxID=2822344 RepID=A0A916JBZ3_9BACT|nr:hypothetical protein DYBT9275_02777 [Dyadobacter sp. CECT 9275]